MERVEDGEKIYHNTGAGSYRVVEVDGKEYKMDVEAYNAGQLTAQIGIEAGESWLEKIFSSDVSIQKKSWKLGYEEYGAEKADS